MHIPLDLTEPSGRRSCGATFAPGRPRTDRQNGTLRSLLAVTPLPSKSLLFFPLHSIPLHCTGSYQPAFVSQQNQIYFTKHYIAPVLINRPFIADLRRIARMEHVPLPYSFHYIPFHYIAPVLINRPLCPNKTPCFPSTPDPSAAPPGRPLFEVCRAKTPRPGRPLFAVCRAKTPSPARPTSIRGLPCPDPPDPLARPAAPAHLADSPRRGVRPASPPCAPCTSLSIRPEHYATFLRRNGGARRRLRITRLMEPLF